MNSTHRRIEFEGKIPSIGPVDFLAAEVVTNPPNPFALIRYSVRGKEQSLGLRLDLDKQVFLDSVEAEGGDLREIAQEIVRFLAVRNRSPWFLESREGT